MSVKSSTKPDAWTLSPQMTAAPNMWRDAIAVLPYWHFQYQNLVDGEKVQPDWTVEEIGKVGRTVRINQTSNDDQSEGVPLPFNNNRIYIYLVVFTCPDTSSMGGDFNSRFLGHWNTNSSGNNDGAALAVEISGELFLFTAGENTLGEGSIVVDDNEVHTAAVVFDQVNGRVVQVIDGILDYDNPYSDTSSDPSATFGVYLDKDQAIEPNIAMQAAFEVATVPSSDVLKKWTLNPFAMLRPAGF